MTPVPNDHDNDNLKNTNRMCYPLIWLPTYQCPSPLWLSLDHPIRLSWVLALVFLPIPISLVLARRGRPTLGKLVGVILIVSGLILEIGFMVLICDAGLCGHGGWLIVMIHFLASVFAALLYVVVLLLISRLSRVSLARPTK